MSECARLTSLIATQPAVPNRVRRRDAGLYRHRRRRRHRRRHVVECLASKYEQSERIGLQQRWQVSASTLRTASGYPGQTPISDYQPPTRPGDNTFVPIAMVSGILYTYLYHLSNIGQRVSSGKLNLVWYMYVSSMPLLLLHISKKVNIRFFERAGQLSFGIYLMHPLFLFIMYRMNATVNVILYDILGFFIIYSLSYTITKWLGATPWGKYIVG